METAFGYYELKKRFQLSDTEIAIHYNGIQKSQLNKYINLITLPTEVQNMIDREELTITKAYEISRLAYDIHFLATGRNIERVPINLRNP